MAAPSSDLERVLRQSALQGSIDAGQERQLRATLAADADRLDLLDSMAASGRLRGFAVDGAISTLIGTYDKHAGVINLPAASFQARDLDAVVGLQALIADFAHKSWQDAAGRHTVSQDMVDNLQATFNGSPELAAQIKSAVALSHVQHFSLLENGMAAGATYDGSTADGSPKGINIPPLALQSSTLANPRGRYDARDLTFVLGHEIQHGFNGAEKDRATRAFLDGLVVQANQRSAIHDYTDELRAYIGAGRDDEAKAQIAGWNALLDRQRQASPHADGLVLMLATRNDRVLDFIRPDPSDLSKAAGKSGLVFNPDGSLSPTPANIAAMGQHYFDRPSPLYAQPGERPVALGEGRPGPSANYTNYYGTWAVERIIATEDRANVSHRGMRPQIAIDMAGLGLREDLIEMEGLDLGADRRPRPYLDTSRTPAVPGHFHHTQDASMGHDHQHVPVIASERIRPSGDPLVDAWIDALQDGDDAAARAVQHVLAKSAEGQRLWSGATTGALDPEAGHRHAFEASPDKATRPSTDYATDHAHPIFNDPRPHRLAELQHEMER